MTAASIRWTSLLSLLIAFSLACPSDVLAKKPKDESNSSVKNEASGKKKEAGEAQDTATRVRGKVIVIGPDGKKKEFNFGPGAVDGNIDGNIDFDINFGEIPGWLKGRQKPRILGGPGTIFVGQAGGKYMIGLHCTPVPDALRSHLDLPEGAGLLVRHIMPESPAAKAGIEQHDVLVRAGDTTLKSVSDMMDAVQKAETKPLTLSLIRHGKQQKVDATPTERPAGVDIDVDAAMPKELEQLRRRLQESGIELPADLVPQMIPLGEGKGGIILDLPGMPDGGSATGRRLEKNIDELREQVEQLQKAVRKLQKRQDAE